jgi:hypothetical protein
MSFAIPSSNQAQDNQQSTLFSLDGEVFAPAAIADFEVDLEKQQQHHLRQFLYFQGLALQRSENQQREQRALAATDNFEDINSFYNGIGTPLDTLSSGSVEDHLQDFIAIESLSDSSLSAPSTPDLLGTNIASLSHKQSASTDLDFSPTSLIQTPGNSMTDAPSPLQDASIYSQELDLQSKFASKQVYNQFGTAHALDAAVQYPHYYGQGVSMQQSIPNAANDGMVGNSSQLQQVARQRSFSIAAPYAGNQYTQPGMPPFYVSNYPVPYQQPYMAGVLQPAGVFDGPTMMPIDSHQHQRTFSLPMGNLPVSYFNPGLSLPAQQRASASIEVPNVDVGRESPRNTLVESSGPIRRKTQEQRPKPYERPESKVSRSPSSSGYQGNASGGRAPAIVSTDSSARRDSSRSSTPATVMPENLKDLPASMIRNPHGGGRGYVPGETQEDPKKRHKCGICGRGFARLYNLKVCIT